MNAKLMTKKEIIVDIIMMQRGHDLTVNRYDAGIMADKIIHELNPAPSPNNDGAQQPTTGASTPEGKK